jgi:O-antigen/teichoic acid export membrane protein
MQINPRRIAKNTLVLYLRQGFGVIIGLYTIRMVLNILGVIDYGIYNVVGGIVTMFVFLTNSLSSASSRFFAFSLGINDNKLLNNYFYSSLGFLVLLIFFVILIGETIGLWFVDNVLVIPKDRIDDARFIYHISIASFVFTLIVSPFNALIRAHEDMHIYAMFSIIDTLLKLVIVFIIQIIGTDKLRLYGIFSFIAIVLYTIGCISVCVKKYKTRIHFYGGHFKEIFGFSAWNLFGSFVSVFKIQIVNTLLNQFFSPVVVAARSISLSINNAIYSFSINFNVSMDSPIIKAYAANENIEQLLFRSIKYSFFLVYIFILPLIIEMDYVLLVWLKSPPEYTAIFSRLVLIDILIDVLGNQLGSVANATGKIKLYQIFGNGIILLNVPISYIVLFMGNPPFFVVFVSICITFFSLVIRFLIVKMLIGFSLQKIFKECLVPITSVVMLSPVLPLFLHFNLREGILRLLLVVGISCFFVVTSIFVLGMTKDEKRMITAVIHRLLKKGLW